MSTATFTIRTITCLFERHQTSLICHVFMDCLGSFPSHDMLLNLHEFAFDGQNMKYTVNILLSCTLYCAPGLFLGLFFVSVWSFWHHMTGIFTCLYSSGKTNFRQINEWHINEDIVLLVDNFPHCKLPVSI